MTVRPVGGTGPGVSINQTTYELKQLTTLSGQISEIRYNVAVVNEKTKSHQKKEKVLSPDEEIALINEKLDQLSPEQMVHMFEDAFFLTKKLGSMIVLKDMPPMAFGKMVTIAKQTSEMMTVIDSYFRTVRSKTVDVADRREFLRDTKSDDEFFEENDRGTR